MKTDKLALVLLCFALAMGLCGRVLGGIATSTVNQDGTKIDFGDPIPPDNNLAGSASRIGLYDFDFGTSPLSLNFLQARIRLWVQLPIEAEGDNAPYIVFAKAGTTDLQQALINGDAVRTDIRISFNLPDRGFGVVEKQTDFQNLTRQQDLALAAILASDPSNRLEAWLVSDTLKAITVPARGETFEVINGFPVVTFQPFTSTLDLRYVPEPSTNNIFIAGSLLTTLGIRSRRRNRMVSKEKVESCSG